jgi:hypothetical protein
MKHNPITQSDTTLKFDGAERETTGRINQRLMTNQWSGHMNDGRDVNFGRGPTKGNMGCGKPGKPGAMASVTRDSYRAAPTDSVPSSVKIKNPDYINGGAQVRTPGGTRTWDPKAGQNYSGNPDAIRIGQSGGPAYGRVEKGSKPSTSAGSVDFNYGPKKQY